MRLQKKNPRWELEDAARRAVEANRLLAEDRAVLEPRLPTGTVDAFRTDVDAIREASVDAVGDLLAQKGATGGQSELAGEGHRFVVLMREQVERQAPGAFELHRSLGVGDNLQPRQVVRVLANLDKLVALGGAAGDGLVPYGVTVADVQEAARLAEALRAKKRAQDEKKSARSDGVDGRRVLQLRVEATIDRIGTAGKTEFRKDPLKRARYAALFASPSPSPAAAPVASGPSVAQLPPSPPPSTPESGAAGADPPALGPVS